MPEISVYADTRGSGTCRDCGRPITWYMVVGSLRKMPFDKGPVALRTAHDASHRLIEVLDLADSHQATCPEAERRRRPLFP
jgi:hypothetical protein